MVEDLRNGGTLSDAAGKHPECFPKYYIGILQSAELTGKLDETLDNLAGYLEREVETQGRRSSPALSYPMVVMVLAMFTVAMLAGYVLPQFKPLFEELDADLPLPTRMLLFVATLFSDAVVHPDHVRSALFVGTHVLAVQDRQRQGSERQAGAQDPGHQGHRRVRDPRAVLPHPGGDGQGRRAAARGHEDHDRVDRQLGVPRAARGGAGRVMLEGGGFARPLADTGLFPGAAKQMFKVGEETGTLDEQLEVASLYFDRELESRIKKFTTMFEPIMIIFVGVIVGFVAMALVSAMYGVLGETKDQI